MDVTWDPKDDKVLYVTGFEDHVIWKLEIVDLACDKVNVSVFAGKLDERGDADGKAYIDFTLFILFVFFYYYFFFNVECLF